MLQKTTLRNPKVAAITVKLPRPELDPKSDPSDPTDPSEDSEELLLEPPGTASVEADDPHGTRSLKQPDSASFTKTRILRKPACASGSNARSSEPGPATNIRNNPIPTTSTRPIKRSNPLMQEPGPGLMPGSGLSSRIVEPAAPPSTFAPAPLGGVVLEPGQAGPGSTATSTSTLPYLLMGVGFGVLVVVGILGSLIS